MDPSAPALAKDLAVDAPRPMWARLDGYVWLPRMIDKARASRAGTLGTYVYPCPIDRRCQRRLGIDAETFADIAQREPTDAGILAALQRHGIAGAPESTFDPEAYEAELQRGAPER
jgi:hypothetical protein